MKKGSRFTDKFIMNLKPDTKDYWVREGMGFSIRVYPSGEKAWYYIYTFDGRKRFMRLKDGGYPDVSLADAREAFDIAKVKVKNAIDPWTEKQQVNTARIEAPTIKELAADYMKRHAKINKRKSSWTEDQRLLNKDIIPRWGNRKAADIKRRDVIALLDDVVTRGPALAANIKKLVSKMFMFALDKSILDTSPCVRVSLPAPVMARERKLSDSEIKVLLTTELPKASMSDEVKRILQLILYSAQRPGEVAGMHKREIHGHWWTIPSSRSKNKREHLVYLTDTALALIGDVKGYVFPSPRIKLDPDGKVIETHIDENAVAYAIRRNLKDYKPRRKIKGDIISMVKVKEDKKMEMLHFTPHDLRRTATTLMASVKVPKEHRERVLNHAQEKLDGTYNLYDYQDEKQIALETLERKINSILTAKESNVIPITAAQKAA